MKIWIDTEFTTIDSRKAELISIGCVGENNRTFYAVLNDYKPADTSLFVDKYVLPVLHQGNPLVGNQQEIGVLLARWLPSTPVEVIVDYELDARFMKQLLIHSKRQLDVRYNICGPGYFSDEAVDYYFISTGLARHHALYDAVANKLAYQGK